MNKEQLPACWICGATDAHELTVGDVDGMRDMVECPQCFNRTKKSDWLVFGRGYQNLKDTLRSHSEGLFKQLEATQAMNKQLAELPDIHELMHGD